MKMKAKTQLIKEEKITSTEKLVSENGRKICCENGREFYRPSHSKPLQWQKNTFISSVTL
jgi:hypothetical protein